MYIQYWQYSIQSVNKQTQILHNITTYTNSSHLQTLDTDETQLGGERGVSALSSRCKHSQSFLSIFSLNIHFQ